MATLLVSNPPRLQRPSTPHTFPRTNSKSSYWINVVGSTAEISATPIATRTTRKIRSSRTNQTSPISENWSFEQRIRESLQVLKLMEAQGMEPNPSLFCILLKSCADMEDLEMGKVVHDKILEVGLQDDVFIANNLINLYAKCKCFDVARQVFDKMPLRNIVSWTSLISMYNQVGSSNESLKLFHRMKLEKIKPNVFTYTAALNSCAKVGNLEMGFEIHEEIVRAGFDSDAFVLSALIDMYAKCGRIEDARKLFDKMSELSIVAYTAMIDGYYLNNQSKEAINLIRRVLRSGINMNLIDELSFSCMIRSCSQEMALKQGQEIHAYIIKSGYKSGVQIINTLVLLYANCGRMAIARSLFDTLLIKDASLWSRMISGYVKYGMNLEALKIYLSMLFEISEPDSYVISCILDACACLSSVEEGRTIHARAIKAGYGLSEASVVASLVNMYRKCGELEEAHKLVLHKKK